MSKLEEDFLFQCRSAGFPEPEREYKFHPTRRWRLDFFWSAEKTNSHFSVAMEIEGGTWIKGRHVTGSGVEKDIEKYSQLVEYPIIPCTLCGSQDGLQRQIIKNMMTKWEEDFPNRGDIMFKAMSNISPSHMLDRK